MSLSKSILSYISEANTFEEWYRKTNKVNPSLVSDIIHQAFDTNNDQILRRSDVLHPLVYPDQLLQKKIGGKAEYNLNRELKQKANQNDAFNTEFRNAMNAPRKMDDTEFRDAMNAPRSNNGYDGSKAATTLTKKLPSKTSASQSNSKTSSFWSKVGNHISNHKVGYGVGAGAITTAGIGAAALHHRNKNKGILNKIKNNPGKVAGASLAALGAGAGVAALIRYLRKKKKQGK